MQKSLVDFLWVAANDGAFQVTVRDTADTMDEVASIGGATRDRVLNVAQAIEQGYDLSAIGAVLDTTSAATVDDLRTQVQTLTEANEAQAETLASVQVQLEKALAALQAAGEK